MCYLLSKTRIFLFSFKKDYFYSFIKYFTIRDHNKIPAIPAIPDRVGGAGGTSFSSVKIAPTTAPVPSANKISSKVFIGSILLKINV